jgi:hypothetical protein
MTSILLCHKAATATAAAKEENVSLIRFSTLSKFVSCCVDGIYEGSMLIRIFFTGVLGIWRMLMVELNLPSRLQDRSINSENETHICYRSSLAVQVPVRLQARLMIIEN